MDGSKEPTDVYSSLRKTYHPKEKANVTAGCLEKYFTSRHLCDHERQVGTRVQALPASVDDTALRRVIPCDIHKLAKPLKLRKTCGFNCILKECPKHLPRRSLVH
jgi:hypothetical protein